MRDRLLYAIGVALIALPMESRPCSGTGACFGFFELRDGIPYAVEGESWTFDHGSDPLEGWVPANVDAPIGHDVIRWRTLGDFADDGLPPGAPIIDGTGMIWAGVHESEARELCYECGLGYGPGVQRIWSPWLSYSGGDVQLGFEYFQDMAFNWMFVRVQSDVDPYTYSEWDFDDGSSGSWDAPSEYIDIISASRLTGATSIRIEFIVQMMGGPSDQDCSFDSQIGAFGIDNVVVSGGTNASYDFEGGPQGWETVGGGANRDPALYFEVRDLSSYGQGYEHWCDGDNNAMTFHGPGVFPEGRLDGATSPIIDLTPLGLSEIFGLLLYLDELEDYPNSLDPGLWWRVYIRSYPIECAGGGSRWSNWVNVENNGVTGAGCVNELTNLKAGIDGVPELIQIHVGVWSCAACCVQQCEGAEFSPFIDNLQVCVTGQTSGVADDPTSDHAPSFATVSSHPVRQGSTMSLTLSDAQHVALDLFTVDGRRVARLFSGRALPEEELPIGTWFANLPGLQPGLYLVRLNTAEGEYSGKVIWAPE